MRPGLTFSIATVSGDHLFVYDVWKEDDLLRYAADAGFASTTLISDIIPSFNAGRGDPIR